MKDKIDLADIAKKTIPGLLQEFKNDLKHTPKLIP
jgi:hypothetical protein